MNIMNLNASLSGLMVGAFRMSVSADNIARHDVPNSEKNRVIQETMATGGATARAEPVKLDPALRDLDSLSTNIDYAEEAISQMITYTAYQANARVVQTVIGMEDRLIDIKA